MEIYLNVCVNIFINVLVYVSMFVCLCAWKFARICTYVLMPVYVNIYMYACFIYICVFMRLYVNVCR